MLTLYSEAQSSLGCIRPDARYTKSIVTHNVDSILGNFSFPSNFRAHNKKNNFPKKSDTPGSIQMKAGPSLLYSHLREAAAGRGGRSSSQHILVRLSTLLAAALRFPHTPFGTIYSLLLSTGFNQK